MKMLCFLMLSLVFTFSRLAHIASLNTAIISPCVSADIATSAAKLIVNRRGTDPLAFMQTEAIIKTIEAQKEYIVSSNGLLLQKYISKKFTNNLSGAAIPKHVAVTAQWLPAISNYSRDTNILGGNGIFKVESDLLVIPEATTNAESLGFYGAELLKTGQTKIFQSSTNLPLTIMNIGRNYVKGYLLQEKLGGGIYLEYHDKPHFHMPVDQHAGGHLILGKKFKNHYKLSAFKIPYGYAIYTAPNVIHNDAFLFGRYYVVYSLTKEYSTVIIKNTANHLVTVQIQAPLLNHQA